MGGFGIDSIRCENDTLRIISWLESKTLWITWKNFKMISDFLAESFAFVYIDTTTNSTDKTNTE